jgi:Glycosyltransferase like family 2
VNLTALLGTLALPRRCSLIVTIPARNEEHTVAETLDAIAPQAIETSSLVIVFANNCIDATAAIARRCGEKHPQLRLHTAESALPAPLDHVGTARKLLMDYAAGLFFENAKPRGIIATTDADTRVAPDWIEKTVLEMENADAVAGQVEIGLAERRTLPPRVQALYAQENAFRRAWAELEALVDPLPEDPAPRHCSFVAASFAVTAETYRRAGGLPGVPALEDRMFLRALRRVDARVRFSRQVAAETSGRQSARVEGGFGTLVKHLHTQGATGGSLLVENPRQILDDARSRAALRRIWSGSRETTDLTVVANVFETTPNRVLQLLDAEKPFGENYEMLERIAAVRKRTYPLVPMGEAIDGLRATAEALKAAAPIRNNAASGAG